MAIRSMTTGIASTTMADVGADIDDYIDTHWGAVGSGQTAIQATLSLNITSNDGAGTPVEKVFKFNADLYAATNVQMKAARSALTIGYGSALDATPYVSANITDIVGNLRLIVEYA